MKRLLVFLLFVHIFNKVDLYMTEVFYLAPNITSDISVVVKKRFRNEEKVLVDNFEITIKKQINADDDMLMKFNYYDDNYTLLISSNTTLCSADYSDINGTVAALLIQSWGVDNPECPIQENFYKVNSTFEVPEANFGEFSPKESFTALEIYRPNDEMIAAFVIYDDKGWEKNIRKLNAPASRPRVTTS